MEVWLIVCNYGSPDGHLNYLTYEEYYGDQEFHDIRARIFENFKIAEAELILALKEFGTIRFPPNARNGTNELIYNNIRIVKLGEIK